MSDSEVCDEWWIFVPAIVFQCHHNNVIIIYRYFRANILVFGTFLFWKNLLNVCKNNFCFLLLKQNFTMLEQDDNDKVRTLKKTQRSLEKAFGILLRQKTQNANNCTVIIKNFVAPSPFIATSFGWSPVYDACEEIKVASVIELVWAARW